MKPAAAPIEKVADSEALPLDDILDDAFHGSAFAAYVEIACTTGGPPDSEATRRLAFKLYEEALAERRR